MQIPFSYCWNLNILRLLLKHEVFKRRRIPHLANIYARCRDLLNARRSDRLRLLMTCIVSTHAHRRALPILAFLFPMVGRLPVCMACRWYHPTVFGDLDGTLRVCEIQAAAVAGPIGAVAGPGAGSANGGMGCQFVARRWYHPAVLAYLDGAFRVGEILAAGTGPIGAVTGPGAGSANSGMSS